MCRVKQIGTFCRQAPVAETTLEVPLSTLVVRWAVLFALLVGIGLGIGCNAPLAGKLPDGGSSGAAGGAGRVDGAGTAGVQTDAAGAAGMDATVIPPAGDPGWTPIRLLTNFEYDLTVHDLLGVDGPARASFQPDRRENTAYDDVDLVGVDNAVNDSRYEQYFDTADTLVTTAFADPALRARIVTCQPAAAGDQACTLGIVNAFGLRAWRRPLAPDEADGLVALATAALAEGATFNDAIQRVVTAMLSSAPFLYRMEIDPDPTSRAPRALAPYELASRLSYLMWSSTPDDRLLSLAGGGTLARADVLRTEVDRLIDDPRSEGFIEAFGGHWLGADAIASHQVDPVTFPGFYAVGPAMAQELLLFFAELLHGQQSFTGLLDADVNFVNVVLADYYGMSTTGLDATLKRVVNTTDRRKGLLGLGPMLITTSTVTGRTSPFHRGRWILDRLLCEPDPGFGGLIDGIAQDPASTFRARVQAVSADPTCAGCHAAPDTLGLGLEELDAVGVLRATYADGTPVDTRGALPDGTPFAGEAELADLLARDPRFLSCAARQAMRYALEREVDASDELALAKVVATWTSGVPTLRALLEQLVVDQTFRNRRGEGP